MYTHDGWLLFLLDSTRQFFLWILNKNPYWYWTCQTANHCKDFVPMTCWFVYWSLSSNPCCEPLERGTTLFISIFIPCQSWWPKPDMLESYKSASISSHLRNFCNIISEFHTIFLGLPWYWTVLKCHHVTGQLAEPGDGWCHSVGGFCSRKARGSGSVWDVLVQNGVQPFWNLWFILLWFSMALEHDHVS